MLTDQFVKYKKNDVWPMWQRIHTRNSAKLTDQGGSYAFRPTCSPLSIHVRNILPTSNIYIFVYYLFSIDTSEQHVWELLIYSSPT